jgi:hypothetical protein
MWAADQQRPFSYFGIQPDTSQCVGTTASSPRLRTAPTVPMRLQVNLKKKKGLNFTIKMFIVVRYEKEEAMLSL